MKKIYHLFAAFALLLLSYKTNTAQTQKIAAGYNNSLFMCSDGTIYGTGGYGVLGDGKVDYADRINIAKEYRSINSYTSFANNSSRLFVKDDGTLWGSGRNDYGSLGTGNTAHLYSTLQLNTWTDVLGVSTAGNGFDFSLILRSDGTVWSCGYNTTGQLGDGTTIHRTTPTQVLSLTGITAVAAGKNHSLFLKNDGTVWACGVYGLGDGTTTQRLAPVQVLSLTNVVAISAGLSYSLFLKNDGTVWATGSNTYGQLGDGTTTQRNAPVQITSLSGITAISAGYVHALFLKNDGTVWASGHNAYGQLGDGTTTQRNTPVQITSLSNITAVSGGYFHSLFLKNDGTVWACGDNDYGQLGDGTFVDKNTPVQVIGLCPVPCSYTVSFTTTNETCNSCNDGTISTNIVGGTAPYTYTWSNGQTNANLTGLRSDNYFLSVSDASGCSQKHSKTITQPQYARGGGYQSFFVCNSSNPKAVGSNWSGQLGDGTTTSRSTSISITSLTDIKDVQSGRDHTLFLKNDGTVWATGYNNYGMLGDGTIIAKYSPVQINTLSDIIAIAAGLQHSVFLKADGTVWVTGRNDYGQLCDGTNINRNIPVMLSSIKDVASITVCDGTTILLKKDGTVWSCGNNSGNPSTSTPSKIPMQVLSLTNVKKIAGGNYHWLALKYDGTVWASGYNSNGQLGDGTLNNAYYLPIQIPSLSNIVDISAGAYYSLFLKTDGSVYSTGANGNGQLGDGTTVEKYTPIVIPSITNVSSISTGNSHSLFLKNDGLAFACGYNNNGPLGDGTTTTRTSPVYVTNVCSAAPACNPPTAVTYSASSTSAVVNFTSTATNWQVEYGVSPYTFSGTATATLTTNPATLTGLTAGTTYQIKIRSICSGSPSSWSSTNSFNTTCSLSAIYALPYNQSFDATGHCWSSSLITGTTNWGLGASDGVSGPRTGANYAGKNYNNSDALFISPQFNLAAYSANTVQLSVWIFRNTQHDPTDRIRFHVNTAQNLTGATQLLEIFPKNTVAPTVATVGWYNYTVVIPASYISGGNFYVLAQGTTTASSNSWGLGFDDFKIETIVSSNANLSALSSSQGSLSPTFSAGTTNYTVTLPFGSTGAGVLTPTLATTLSTITSNVSASNVAGTAPNNVAYVVVTAQSGATNTYTVTYSVAAAPSNNSSLSSVTPSVGTLSPSFVSSITNYTITLPAGSTSGASLNFTLGNASATTVVTSASNVGGASPANTATIVVTAQDGVTQTTYTVVFNSPPLNNDATLSNLTTSQGALVPAFANTTYAYSVVLPEGTTGTGVVTPTLNTSLSTVTFIQNASNVAGTAPANTATVLVTAQDGTTALYTVVYSIATGIKETSNATNFEVYPNPTNGVFVVNMQSAKIETIKLSVATLTGQVIFEKEISTNNKTISEQIDLSKQAKGIYFVKVIDGIGSQTKRIVLQ